MADYRFIRGLRLRGPKDKDFLRSAFVGPTAPSLRAKGFMALKDSTDEVTVESAGDTDRWYAKFTEVSERVSASMEALGLSTFDREYLSTHLIDGTPLGKLPILEYVDELLETIADLSHRIRATALRRGKAIDRLRKSCAAGKAVGTVSRRSEQVCGPAQHEKVASLIKDIDGMTIDIMRLVAEWRSHLQTALPFHVDGENILFRLAADYAIGSVVSLACGHLRNTSRYNSFFYASPFDAVAAGTVAPSAKPALARWESLVQGELVLQRAIVREQLSFARMGLFHCVLRLPRSMLKVAGMKPGCVLHINDRRRKQDLVSCLGTAYRHLLRRRQQATGKASHLAGLATFSPKALHLQYLRKWIEWVAVRREKREAAQSLLRESCDALLRRRWADWAGRVEIERERARKWRPFLQRSQLQLLRLYTQKWFMHHAFGTISRQVRRVLFLRYFHALHFLVVKRRLARDLGKETRNEEGVVAYPCQLQASRLLGGLASQVATPSLHVAMHQRTQVLERSRTSQEERRQRLCTIILEEHQERVIATGDFLLQTLVLEGQSTCDAVLPKSL